MQDFSSVFEQVTETVDKMSYNVLFSVKYGEIKVQFKLSNIKFKGEIV